jgi:hypothetical protein
MLLGESIREQWRNKLPVPVYHIEVKATSETNNVAFHMTRMQCQHVRVIFIPAASAEDF